MQWRNCTSWSFGSHAGPLKKATTALWKLDISEKKPPKSNSILKKICGEKNVFLILFPDFLSMGSVQEHSKPVSLI